MRYFKLITGIFLFAVGIVFTINGNMGIAPWDTFHQGLSYHVNITFGQASILVGIVILLLNYSIGEKIGIGTLINIFGIGLIIDCLNVIKIIPMMQHFITGILSMTLGMFIIALGSYFYLVAGFGAGPRDGLMVGLHKKLKLPIGLIRGLIEVSVLIIGYFLGGSVGLGTLYLAFAIGPIIQFVFKSLNFNVKTVQHSYFNKSKVS